MWFTYIIIIMKVKVTTTLFVNLWRKKNYITHQQNVGRVTHIELTSIKIIHYIIVVTW